MASKEARFLRQELRENGFVVVTTTHRDYKVSFGLEKAEVVIPAKAEPSSATHTASVKQKEAIQTAFKVVLKDGYIELHRKNGSGLKPYRPYRWSGTRLLPLRVQDAFFRRVSADLKPADFERPTLTHEQACDIERALLKL